MDQSLIEWTAEHKHIVSSKLRYTLVAFTFWFWIVGALFAAIGGWNIAQTSLPISDALKHPGAVLAALGCFIFIVSSFGVLGAHRENLCYLRTYKYFLIVILVFELCTGIFGFAFWPEMKKMADYKISQAIKKYTDDSQLRDMMDYIQRHFECCGSLTVDDWDSNPYYNCGKGGSYRSCGVPWSCCLDMYDKNLQCGLKVRKKRSKKKMSKSIHIIGCLDKLFEFIRVNMVLLGGLAIGCNIPLLLVIFLSHRLTKQIKKLVSKYDEANDTFHWTENKMNSKDRLILTTSEDK